MHRSSSLLVLLCFVVATTCVLAMERLEAERLQAKTTVWETAELVESAPSAGSSSFLPTSGLPGSIGSSSSSLPTSGLPGSIGSSSSSLSTSGLPGSIGSSSSHPNLPGSSESSHHSESSHSESSASHSAPHHPAVVPPHKGKVVVMVNRNVLTDNQVPRNRAEEQNKRSEQDFKINDAQQNADRSRREQDSKQGVENDSKNEARKRLNEQREQEMKLNHKRKEESEQKEKLRLTESEQKEKDRVKEQAEKTKIRQQEQQDKQAAQVKEQDDKREQAAKKAAEQQQKNDPCNDQSRKFVPKATSKNINVRARENSLSDYGYPVDTGIFVKAGSALSISANGVWYAAPGYASDAKGMAQWGIFNAYGVGFPYGTLVARIGGGQYFSVGSSFFNCKMDQEGRLYLVYWDSDSENNSGEITVNIKYTKANEEDDTCFKKDVPHGTQKMFIVAAKENSVAQYGIPLDTNILLSQKSPLRISVHGEWYSTWNHGLPSSANGRQGIWNGFRVWSLVGRIGLGSWFFVGEDFYVCELNQAGPLQLAYWDGNSEDNSGTLQATVNYQRLSAQSEDDCSHKTVTGGSTKNVQVYARQNSVSQNGNPLDTGVDVNAGQLLKITSEGTWYAAGGNQLQSDPNGWGSYYNTQGSNLRAFSLVAKIGSNGNWFFVGSDYFNCYTRTNGRLYFGYWDSDSDNNSGYVTATITH